MACLEIQHSSGTISAVAENTPYGPEWKFTGRILRDCNPTALDDLHSWWTSEGIMVGNVVKSVTNAVGIKQCLSCKGRQQRLNEKGLELQQKLKDLF